MKLNTLIVVFCVTLVGTVNSQIVGNPVGTKGTKEWSVSLNGGYMTHSYDYQTYSRRLLLKSEWGITPWFDVYFMGGVHDLEISFSRADFTDYKSKIRFCYGAGFDIAFQPKRDLPFGIWSGAQIFKGPAKGDYFENLSFAGTTIIKKYKYEYNWTETKGFLGLIYYGKHFKLYLAKAGWLLQNTTTLRQYSQSGTSWSLETRKEGEDRSTIWSGGVFGLEFDFPGNYTLTFEGLLFNEEDYQLMVGISQTGNPGW